MMYRFTALLLLLIGSTAFSQPPDQPASNVPKSFHDPLLNVTYFYPGRFTPAAPDPAASPNGSSPSSSAAPPHLCAESTLSASSISPVGTSVFVLSTIDNTCPNVLHGASTDLGAFTREQVLREIKQYGDPVITQEPTHYTIDGHPAVVTLASAQAPASGTANITPPKVTYAAKACFLGTIPVKPRKRSDPVDQPKHVLCFDFTTQERDLLSLVFGFSIQFDNDSPQPLVPGSALR
jgi:hypothetical protein